MKKLVKHFFPLFAFLLSLSSALFWVALRINHSGISKFLGADHNQSFLIMNLPVMVCVLAWIGCILAFLGLLLWSRKKGIAIAAFVITVIVTLGAAVVVAFGAKDYMRFIMVHFWKSAAVAGAILIFALVLFFPVKNNRLTVLLKGILVAAVILGAVIIGYQLRPCDFTYGAVVYAVEDDYQIVFSTSDSAIAWVEIGGECYYDLYAGSMRSADKVHKVTVPQTVLDKAKGYTVCAQQMIYRGPFGGYKGETISREYAFRPVDSSNGLNYFALSDVHEAVDAAISAATTYDDTDFLILLGDMVSMVETEADAQLTNELAHGITGGEFPVIYARGNHEIKGEYSEVLYKYVGSKNQEYYYWVTLSGEVFAVVLDVGEDHDDDWWEYYGTAQFERYQARQTQMLEDILEDGSYEHYRYRLGICHIPLVYVGSKGYFAEFNKTTTQQLNELEIDACFSGHKHVIWALQPGTVEPYAELVYSPNYSGTEGKVDGGYLTDFAFPTFLVGRRSLELTGGTQSDGYDQYVCLSARVDFAENRSQFNYVNSNQEIPTGYYPFVGDDPYLSYMDVLTELRRPEQE